MGWIVFVVTCIVFVIAIIVSDLIVWVIFAFLLLLTGALWLADSDGLWISKNMHKKGYPYFFPPLKKIFQGRNTNHTITTQSKSTKNSRFQNKAPFPKQVSYTHPTTESPMPTAVDVTCPKCGAPMVVAYGRYGRFYGCSKFPQCHGSRSVENALK